MAFNNLFILLSFVIFISLNHIFTYLNWFLELQEDALGKKDNYFYHMYSSCWLIHVFQINYFSLFANTLQKVLHKAFYKHNYKITSVYFRRILIVSMYDQQLIFNQIHYNKTKFYTCMKSVRKLQISPLFIHGPTWINLNFNNNGIFHFCRMKGLEDTILRTL